MITLAAAKKITLDKVATLRPKTRAKVEAWLAECEAAGLNLYVYEGYRTCERQAELLKMGRHVTRAGPGQSMHQYRLAIDFVPLVEAKKAAGMFEAGWGAAKVYAVAHSIAAKHGLRKLSWETPHLEDADYGDWKSARAVFGNPCTPAKS